MSNRPRSILILLLASLALLASRAEGGDLERVRISDDGRSFVLDPSGDPFRPVGFNYDHDEQGRLIEDYWVDEWAKVEEDFREMADLGANVVRIHLQFGRFMDGPDAPDAEQLDRLSRLIDLADRLGLYLDLTGLGCYHKADVPDWYDALPEADRWASQARFWQAVASRGVGKPAVFFYDLMNEPVVPGRKREDGDWLGPAFAGKYFVQFITLDPVDRTRPEVARQWIETLRSAIREVDPETPITVGLVPWSLDRPGLTSGFVPSEIEGGLDFLCVHLYPESGKVDEAIETLRGFDLGKPLILEETFPLKSSPEEFEEFLVRAQPIVDGVIGFYWGTAPGEDRPPESIGEALLLRWLELFRKHLAEPASEEEPDT